MWNGSICFIKKKTTEKDKEGFCKSEIEMSEELPANIGDATRSDETLGNQRGYSADISVEILACNYSGESMFKDIATGKIYEVKRTYRKQKTMMIALTGEERERGKI